VGAGRIRGSEAALILGAVLGISNNVER